MTVRTDIVDALKTVPELTPTGTMPDVIAAGTAWPEWAGNEPRTACGQLTTWYVYAALPAGNLASTVEAGDDFRDAIWNALAMVAKVVRSEPWRIPIEPGQQGIPVVRYTLEV